MRDGEPDVQQVPIAHDGTIDLQAIRQVALRKARRESVAAARTTHGVHVLAAK